MSVLISRSGRLGTMNKIEKNRPSQSSDWEEYRDIVQRLYVTEDKSLPDVVDEMKRKHQFYATERQYKRRITEWQLDKNVKDEEMRAIIAVEAMRLRQGKKSTFHVRGRIVNRKKIDRFVQRKRIDRNALDSLPGMQQFTDSSYHAVSEEALILPESVRCSTPPDYRTALLDISKSYRGSIPAKNTKPDAMIIDIESYNNLKFDYQNKRVKNVYDMATKVTAMTEAPGFPNLSASTDAADGSATSDGQSKHGLADSMCSRAGLANYMTSLKGNFVGIITCCDTTLTSLHGLLQHYDEQHSESCKQLRNSDSDQNCTFPQRLTSIIDTARSSGDSGRLSSTPKTSTPRVIPEPSIHQFSSQSSGPEVPDIHIEIDSREPHQKILDEFHASLNTAASDPANQPYDPGWSSTTPLPVKQVHELFSSIRKSLARGTAPSQAFFDRVRNCLDRINQHGVLRANMLSFQIPLNSLASQAHHLRANSNSLPQERHKNSKLTINNSLQAGEYKQPAGLPAMPNIDRTLSDIYQDELYNPPNTYTPLDQSHRYRLQEDSFPRIFPDDLLQAAQNRHIKSRSASSSTNGIHEHSPFTQGSSYATCKEQQKAALDACVLLQHQPKPSYFAPPRTISPKDVALDYNKAREDGKMSLFDRERQER
ncbi:MAG: hypothetical protein LQ337_008032 [Flavoplaca oasis]|nr:MAG: hypothetical protein LQ337_008032 [Flavoplaca oasis]